MANVLHAILKEDLVAWIYYDKDRNERYLATTQLRTDEVSLVTDLLIYSFTSLGQIDQRHIINGFKTFSKYARANDCRAIIAYSANDKLVELLKHLGASANYKLIQVEV